MPSTAWLSMRLEGHRGSVSTFAELMAVVGMANAPNRLANGYQVAIDDRFRPPAPVEGPHGVSPVAAGASGARRHQRQQPVRSPGAAAGGRKATRTRASTSLKRATASGAAPAAAGQSTRRRRPG
jgi:hypothetical protein